jgi:hypothetical protein
LNPVTLVEATLPTFAFMPSLSTETLIPSLSLSLPPRSRFFPIQRSNADAGHERAVARSAAVIIAPIFMLNLPVLVEHHGQLGVSRRSRVSTEMVYFG